jgi:hypothetical protein
MQADRESCELLRAIARSADADVIRRLAVGVGDWNSLLGLAQDHRVLPLVWSRLTDMGSGVPLMVQERLRAEYERNVLHTMANAAELIAVLKALGREGIPALPFKGVVLGASIYGDFTARSAGDLDVLIHYGDRKRAMRVVVDRGFELLAPVRANGVPVDANEHEYHFERQVDGMVVELCWSMRLNRFMRDLGMDWAWPQRRVTMLAGAEVPDMSIEMTLLMLCVHGSKHVWWRFIWTCDVAHLLASSPGLDWGEVVLEAKRSGLRRCLAVGVLLAHRVAGAAIPEAFLRGFEADATASRLANHFETNMFDAPGSTPKGWVPYGMQMLDLRDRVRLLWPPDWRSLNERDQAAV